MKGGVRCQTDLESKIKRGRFLWMSDLQIFGFKSGVFGKTCQHARPNFFFVVESKYRIRPTST
jgi:hypothetical protein